MIKFILLLLLLIIAAFIPFIADFVFVSKIKFIKSIDWIAWYAALLSLYGYFEKHLKRHKDIEHLIYINTLVNQLEKMDEATVNIDILQKMTINDGLDKITQKVEGIQEDVTTIFNIIANKLGNVDQHFKSEFKKAFNNDIEENIYPKFSYLLQNIQQNPENQKKFKEIVQRLHDNMGDEKEKLVQIIEKIRDKC
ncbi:MAG: hypothetical protein J6A33_06835 [Alphaproteobacteria bacterium]|nr:hypothetical protein [Alphaproteobacteria bacterium]